MPSQFLGVLADALPHHGVLAHEDLGGAAEGDAGLLDLLGADVVDLDDEALGVRRHELLHADEVLGLAFGGEGHLLRCIWSLLTGDERADCGTSDAGEFTLFNNLTEVWGELDEPMHLNV